jgi:hypothetical protein
MKRLSVKNAIREREARCIMVAEMYLRGLTMRQIAKEVNDTGKFRIITHVTAFRDCEYLLKQWKEQRINDVDTLKQAELQKLLKLERAYWDAWDRSVKEGQKKVSVKSGFNSFGDIEEKTTENLILFGDPRFLQGIERVIKQRCEILGLNAPVKMDATFVQTEPIVGIVINEKVEDKK